LVRRYVIEQFLYEMVVGLFSNHRDVAHIMQINLRSTQTNAAFRKLFALPPEEFLIDDFTCHLKRKMPLQVVMVFLLFVFYLNGTSKFPHSQVVVL
jgi:hypothetical protein